MDVNARTRPENATALFISAYYGDARTVSMLLDRRRGRIEVNAARRNGDTPLHVAAYFGRVPAASRLLREPGVDPGLVNAYGLTALDYAIGRQHAKLVALFLPNLPYEVYVRRIKDSKAR